MQLKWLNKNNKGRYQSSYKKHQSSLKSLGWISKQAQTDRFNELLVDLNLEGKSILDIGCGFGDIIPFIKKKAKSFLYTGVDQVPEFIEVAKKKYEKQNFIVHDYFTNPLSTIFDVVLASGSLNSNIPNALKFRKDAIKTMFDHAKYAVVFNMAGGNPTPKNKKSYRIYYSSSEDILKYCFTLSNKIILRHHYRNNDFTIIIFK